MKRIASGLLLAVTLSFACAASQDVPPGGTGAVTPKLEDVPRLTVRGEAELEKPADQVRLRVGVITENQDATEALDENSERMSKVVAALQRAGLDEDELQTGRFSIRPVYSRRPRGAGPEWQPEIIGYEVQNSIVVKTKRLEMAGELIGACTRAGANSVNVEAFELSDPRRHRREAIVTATRHAMEDAQTFAEAANVRLVRIIGVNLSHSPVNPLETRVSQARAMAAEAATPPIQPGDVTVRASLSVVFEIAPIE